MTPNCQVASNKIWLGYGFNRNMAHFINPHYDDYASDTDHREGMIRVSGVVWFTNIDIQKRHEDLILYKTYKGHEDEYPKFDNYNAINVDKTKDIPMDFDGAIGVPITFMDKYNPEQFEIISSNDIRINDKVPFKEHGLSKDKDSTINGKPTYVRIVIKNRKPSIL